MLIFILIYFINFLRKEKIFNLFPIIKNCYCIRDFVGDIQQYYKPHDYFTNSCVVKSVNYFCITVAECKSLTTGFVRRKNVHSYFTTIIITNCRIGRNALECYEKITIIEPLSYDCAVRHIDKKRI